MGGILILIKTSEGIHIYIHYYQIILAITQYYDLLDMCCWIQLPSEEEAAGVDKLKNRGCHVPG